MHDLLILWPNLQKPFLSMWWGAQSYLICNLLPVYSYDQADHKKLKHNCDPLSIQYITFWTLKITLMHGFLDSWLDGLNSGWMQEPKLFGNISHGTPSRNSDQDVNLFSNCCADAG